jgi:hypothetical protein
MAIALKCPNGHALAVAEEHAGKRVVCPTCRSILEVPASGPAVSISLTCPNGHALTTPREHAGKKVKCPMCQAIAEVPSTRAAPPPLPPGAYTAAPQDRIREGAPPAKAEYGDVTFEEEDRPRRKRPRAEWEEEEDERPRKRRPRREEEDEYDYEEDDRPRKISAGMKKRQQLKLVNLGLGFHYAGLVIVLVGFLGNLCLALLGPFVFGSLAAASLMGVLYLLLFVAVGLVTPGLWITGSILCLYVPPKSGAFPLVLTSLVLDGVALLLMSSLWWFLGLFAMYAGLVLIASWILFLLFLRTLATYLREHGCANEAMQLVYFFVALVVGIIVFVLVVFLLGFLVGARAPWLLVVVMLIGGITLLVFEIKFLLRNLGLIGELRQAITTRG